VFRTLGNADLGNIKESVSVHPSGRVSITKAIRLISLTTIAPRTEVLVRPVETGGAVEPQRALVTHLTLLAGQMGPCVVMMSVVLPWIPIHPI
jgi:hypothetical protein